MYPLFVYISTRVNPLCVIIHKKLSILTWVSHNDSIIYKIFEKNWINKKLHILSLKEKKKKQVRQRTTS